MPVTEARTLLQFLLDLLRDPNAQAAFAADPQGTLAAAGLDNMCFADVRDALPLVMDHAPAAVAARYDDDLRAGTASTAAVVSDPDHDWDRPAWTHHDDHDHGHHWTPGPVPPHHAPEIEKVVQHLNWVTNNYSFDSHDANFTTALDQHIIANGDVTTTVDTHPQIASGDGAVAVAATSPPRSRPARARWPARATWSTTTGPRPSAPATPPASAARSARATAARSR